MVWGFHVKHSFFFNDLFSLVDKNKKTLIKIDSFSIVPHVVSLFKNKKTFLVVDSLFFDDYYSSFPVDKNIVGLPYVLYESLSFFSSFHETLFQRGFNKLSGKWEEFDVCVVDKKNIKRPLFSKAKPNVLISASPDFTFDKVLLFLKKNNYKKVDFIESWGDFVVRGSIVDVFSFGEKNPFRIDFFDNPFRFFEINLVDGGIEKPLRGLTLSPLSEKGGVCLGDLIGEGCLVLEYKKGVLTVLNKNISSGVVCHKKPLVSFDFLGFSSVFKSKKKIASSWLCSLGFSYGGEVFYPEWFLAKKQTFKKKPLEAPVVLIEGDYYVHSSFGVCVFLGFEEKKSNQDRMCFSFSDGVLKVDIKFLFLISPFASKDFGEKQLDSLNKTKKWERKKKKAELSAKGYVKNIVNNYAKRSLSSKDPCLYEDDIFSLFMSGFKYKDTVDQKQSWLEILSDLCSNKPMDRLLCGDVGFGKTEVAVRAAFVCLCNNKSVVVVCPTTILVQQLFDCFSERLSSFGFSCFSVSRLTKNSKGVVCSFLSKEEPSVIIGTHSIIRNKDVLKKVGLFIVDEEHRFGVKDKEFVFSVNNNIDYLSMSATPIPRSLQFSLSNVRDISTMLSPPVLRKPIITHILKYSFVLLKNIILNEILRGGQVFVVDNSVDKIVFLFNKLSREVSGVSFALLYGSQDKIYIKKTMESFRSKNIDVLISTTIIESGIDVPSANTLVVLNSHMFGLSQLYQLRGRVGRSGLQGYSFFFIPNKNLITPQGLRRLSSLQKHTELGSGYDIALSDLDIRGPGALFGFSQSGTSLVGFGYYTKLLSRAVSLLFPDKNAIVPENLPDVSLGSDFIPKNYITLDRDRVSVYSFVSSCVDIDRLNLFYKDCILKFGPPPFPFVSFFNSREVSILLFNKDISKISVSSNNVVVCFSSFIGVSFENLLIILDGFFAPKKIRYFFREEKRVVKFQFNYKGKDVYILIKSLVKVLYE